MQYPQNWTEFNDWVAHQHKIISGLMQEGDFKEAIYLMKKRQELHRYVDGMTLSFQAGETFFVAKLRNY